MLRRQRQAKAVADVDRGIGDDLGAARRDVEHGAFAAGLGLAVVEAADRFNSSQYRRTVSGIAKSLGTPNVSIHALSGVNADVVVTIAWDISWYQYRVTADSAPVRLAERGHDPAELDPSFTEWNAHLEEDGRVVPDIARL